MTTTRLHLWATAARTRLNRGAAIAIGVACIVLTGCQSSSTAHSQAMNTGPTAKFVNNANPALVLPSPDAIAMDDQGVWESSRLDSTMGSADAPYGTGYGAAVIRQYENLTNSNGTPRDNSWTYARSVQVRTGP